MCTFTGDRPTRTRRRDVDGHGGYISNTEINNITLLDETEIDLWHGRASDLDMPVYDDVIWLVGIPQGSISLVDGGVRGFVG